MTLQIIENKTSFKKNKHEDLSKTLSDVYPTDFLLATFAS